MEFKFPVRVYYEDTDALGIVYNANYLKFFERARTEWLRAIGIDQTSLLSNNVGFAVVSANIRFKAPARLNDALTVTVGLHKLSKASMIFNQAIVLEDSVDERVLVEAEIKICCIAPEAMEPRALPKPIWEELRRAC